MKRAVRGSSHVVDVVATLVAVGVALSELYNQPQGGGFFYVGFAIYWALVLGGWSFFRMVAPIRRLTVSAYRESLAVTRLDPSPFLIERLRPLFLWSLAPLCAVLLIALLDASDSNFRRIWLEAKPSLRAGNFNPIWLYAKLLALAVEHALAVGVAIGFFTAHASLDLLCRLCRPRRESVPLLRVGFNLVSVVLLYLYCFCLWGYSNSLAYIAYGAAGMEHGRWLLLIIPTQWAVVGIVFWRIKVQWRLVKAAYLDMDPPVIHARMGCAVDLAAGLVSVASVLAVYRADPDAIIFFVLVWPLVGAAFSYIRMKGLIVPPADPDRDEPPAFPPTDSGRSPFARFRSAFLWSVVPIWAPLPPALWIMVHGSQFAGHGRMGLLRVGEVVVASSVVAGVLVCRAALVLWCGLRQARPTSATAWRIGLGLVWALLLYQAFFCLLGLVVALDGGARAAIFVALHWAIAVFALWATHSRWRGLQALYLDMDPPPRNPPRPSARPGARA